MPACLQAGFSCCHSQAMKRCRQLLRHFPTSMTNFIWFIDKKLSMVESSQKCTKRLLICPSRYTQMGCCGMSLAANLVKLQLFTNGLCWGVGPGANSDTFPSIGAKIDGHYYREVLLLPDISEFSDCYTFQQDSAPAHRARDN